MLTTEEVSGRYPGADSDVINHCRILIWAMITTWRWHWNDELPNGSYWATEGLNQLRTELGRAGLDLNL